MISYVAIITQFKNLFATEIERGRERERERTTAYLVEAGDPVF